MIDVKSTLFKTIKDKMHKMRFLGQYDPITFKHILSLIVLDDIYEWSSYLDEGQTILKRLLELRTQFILDHGEFIVEMTRPNNFYINVNTPQTNQTWKRVWDAPDLINLYDKYIPLEEKPKEYKPFTPDPTCPVSVVYFDDTATHKPNVDIDELTICEKMNIYINRETGQMYYLDPDTCLWKTLKGQLLDGIDWNDIDNKPTIYQGLQHTLGEESLTTELLTEDSPISTIEVAGEDEIDDVL